MGDEERREWSREEFLAYFSCRANEAAMGAALDGVVRCALAGALADVAMLRLLAELPAPTGRRYA